MNRYILENKINLTKIISGSRREIVVNFLRNIIQVGIFASWLTIFANCLRTFFTRTITSRSAFMQIKANTVRTEKRMEKSRRVSRSFSKPRGSWKSQLNNYCHLYSYQWGVASYLHAYLHNCSSRERRNGLRLRCRWLVTPRYRNRTQSIRRWPRRTHVLWNFNKRNKTWTASPLPNNRLASALEESLRFASRSGHRLEEDTMDNFLRCD